MTARTGMGPFLPLLIGVFASFLLLVASEPAQAVILSNWNVSELNTSGDNVTVDVGTNASGQVTLTVRWHEGAGPGGGDPLSALGIQQFFYNQSDTILSVSGGFSDTSQWNFDGQEADGFGNFSSRRSSDPGGTGGITSNLVFTINSSTPGSFTEFAGQVRYSGGCSGWVSNRTTGSIGSDTNCAPSPVPEPASLLLVGTGLVATGLFARKRLARFRN